MKAYDLVKIGKRVREVRDRLGLKQKEFVKVLDIAATTLSDIETGKVKPGFDVLYRLSSGYKVNMDYLFYGRGEVFVKETDINGSPGELAGFWCEEPFGDFTGDVRDMMEAMRLSRLALGAITSFAREYLFRNEELIKKDIALGKAKQDIKNEKSKDGGEG